jgi:threonine synthase
MPVDLVPLEIEGDMAVSYELRCRDCGKRFANEPLSSCDECFSPLEVTYDMDAAKRTFTRAARRACGATSRCCRFPRIM